jgi:hypothetical protein
MSAEIELYQPTQFPHLWPAPVEVESTSEVIALIPDEVQIPVHPDVNLKVIVSSPDSECMKKCPIVQHGLSEIMNEPSEAVVKSLVRWVKGVNDNCNAGPQKNIRPRFFIVGSEIEVITCGSMLAKNHPRFNKSKTAL